MTKETAQEWHQQDVAAEGGIQNPKNPYDTREKQLLLVWHETALFHNRWTPKTELTREEYDAGIQRTKNHVPGQPDASAKVVPAPAPQPPAATAPAAAPPEAIRLPTPPAAPVPTPPDDPPPLIPEPPGESGPTDGTPEPSDDEVK